MVLGIVTAPLTMALADHERAKIFAELREKLRKELDAPIKLGKFVLARS